MPLPGKNTGSSNLKNSESRRQNQTCLSYAEAHPVLRKAKNRYPSNFNHLPPRGNEGGSFLCFCFHKIGSKGATALVTRLAGRLRTSRIVANTVHVSVQETLSYEGVIIDFVNKSNTGFCR